MLPRDVGKSFPRQAGGGEWGGYAFENTVWSSEKGNECAGRWGDNLMSRAVTYAGISPSWWGLTLKKPHFPANPVH